MFLRVRGPWANRLLVALLAAQFVVVGGCARKGGGESATGSLHDFGVGLLVPSVIVLVVGLWLAFSRRPDPYKLRQEFGYCLISAGFTATVFGVIVLALGGR